MKRKLRWLNKFLNRWEFLILLVGLVIIFRIPSLFEPHHYGDEEIYFVMGRAWREGIPLYSGVFDHKPPLIYIIAGIAQSVFWFRAILMAWMAVHTVLVWLVAQEIWGKKRKSLVFLATLAFAFLTTWPGLEGNIPNAELFMMMPLTASLLVLLKSKRGQTKKYFLAGLLAGVGFLFKVPVMFDFLAFVLYFWFFKRGKLVASIKSLADKDLWIVVAGFVLPVAMTIVYYFSRGIGQDYLRAALLINFGYVSSWSTSSQSFDPLASGLFLRGIFVALFTLALYIFRAKLPKKFVLISLWLVFSVFGSLLSGRPYPHYLLQPVVPLVFFLPFVFVIESVLEWVVVGIVIAGGIMALNGIGFWYYPTSSYYRNFVNVVTGRMPKEEYLVSFSNSRMNYPLAEYLNNLMDPGDSLYVWGSDSTIYNLTGRTPAAGKYIVSFHVRDFGAYDEVASELARSRAEYIVVQQDAIPFDELFALLDQFYIKIKVVEGASIYRRF